MPVQSTRTGSLQRRRMYSSGTTFYCMDRTAWCQTILVQNIIRSPLSVVSSPNGCMCGSYVARPQLGSLRCISRNNARKYVPTCKVLLITPLTWRLRSPRRKCWDLPAQFE